MTVEDGKIVLKSQDSNQPKVKKVRFVGIEEQNICSKEGDENDFFVSDKLIDSLEAENKTKRCPRVIGTEVKVMKSAVIPAESLCFVKAKISKKFTGNVIVRPNMCAHPGMEWIIPSCVVKVSAGKLKIPVLNMKMSSLVLRCKDFIAYVDTDFDSNMVVVGQEEQPENPICSFVENAVEFVGKLKILMDARVGENLSEEESVVFELLSKYLRCFPSANGELGFTKMAEHFIDTSDAQPISCVPYVSVSAMERKIIIE